jgi:tetratricopeptide (TPR) repeat protein
LPASSHAVEYRQIFIKPQKPGIDNSSRSLTAGAWAAFKNKDFDAAIQYAEKCIRSFSKSAQKQQSSLNELPPKDKAFSYWALNDVATCHFIKALSLLEQDRREDAKAVFTEIIASYPHAQCWDTGGWFWCVADGARDQLLMLEKRVDFGNYTSETLTSKAWKALDEKNHEAVHIYADKCILLYENTAREQETALAGAPLPEGQAVFQYWALNDVATSLFIKARSLILQGEQDKALGLFRNIIDYYPHAQCWDPQGWFWSVAQGAQDQIVMAEKGIDYGDYKSSTLTVKAWESLGSGKYEELDLYADKCLTIYEKMALEQQSELKAPVAKDENAHLNWALNDVATSLFIKAKGLAARGRQKESRELFEKIIAAYPWAQCWDPRGWFWNVAEGARDQLFMMEHGIDFGDYTSQTLTTKAWKAYEQGDLEAALYFIEKCRTLYEEEALKQQASLTGFAPKEKIFNYWALNDIATCYFIKGKILFQKDQFEDAVSVFRKIRQNYLFAQCWDPKGWFWKVAVGADAEIKKIDSIMALRDDTKMDQGTEGGADAGSVNHGSKNH